MFRLFRRISISDMSDMERIRSSSTMGAPAADRRRQGGFGLVEVLVSVLLLSFGLLGLIGLQARASQFAVGAEDLARASHFADHVAAEMRARRTLTLPEPVLSAASSRIGNATSGGLPQGELDVAVDGQVATLTITWQQPGRAQSQYRMQVILP